MATTSADEAEAAELLAVRDRGCRLIFEHRRFAAYLLEADAADASAAARAVLPTVLRICARPGAGDAEAHAVVAGRGGSCRAPSTSSASAAAQAHEIPLESLLYCLGEQGQEEASCVEGAPAQLPFTVARARGGAELLVAFREPPAPSAATAGSSTVGDSRSQGGCWYGCGDDEDEASDIAAAASPAIASSAAAAADAPPGPALVAGAPAPAAGLARSPCISADLSSGGASCPGGAEDSLAGSCPYPTRGAVRLASWVWAEGELQGDEAAQPEEVPNEVAGKSSSCSGTTEAPAEEADPASDGLPWQLGAFADSARAFNGGTSPTSSAAGTGTAANDAAGIPELVCLTASKVEWRLPEARRKLREHPKGSRIFSPEFEAFAVNGLGLVFYPNGNLNAKLGYCSLGLKAPHGTRLRYKLSLGSTERFTDLRHNVTESWGFVDMCRIEEELREDDDLLRLGVEIIDDIDVNESLVCVSPNKIEWCISNLQSKLLYYRKDVALHSDEFSVCGVDKLRLKFYPAGKKEAELGWCSLYLEAPKGSELRCRVAVGRKSMSFDRVEKFGEDSIWGFLALCKLRDELEQDGDVVRVSLEVLETKRLDSRLNDAEDTYLKTLSSNKRAWLLKELDRVEKMRTSGETVPMRFRVLQLDISDQAKAAALTKLETMQSDVLSGESAKLKKWIDGLLSIPFGTLRRPLVTLSEGRSKVQNYLDDARLALDSAVFGHKEAKRKIVQLLCQWISNPQSMSFVLGIQGPPGNGKTTLCRKGIAEALGRPFVQISLGGATDASMLEGHSYTYVGSSWGRIAGLLMEARCMNPVVFFDELDKVSETPRGEEITGVLTHLTDHSQNKAFADRYFDGIPLDVSRALFIFSFNDESRINQVLKDRLTVINTSGFDQAAKLSIAQEYLLPELLANVGLKKGDVLIDRDSLDFLCQRCGVSQEEGGVRGIKQALESVVLHINELRILQEDIEQSDSKAQPQSPMQRQQKADGAARSERCDGATISKQPPVGASHASVAVGAGDADEYRKADGGYLACSLGPQLRREGKESCLSGRRAVQRTPRIALPVVLTRDLVELLVDAKPRQDFGAHMYI